MLQAELLQDELRGALEALGGSAGNDKLHELLGWDESTYDTVRASLMAKGLFQPGVNNVGVRVSNLR